MTIQHAGRSNIDLLVMEGQLRQAVRQATQNGTIYQDIGSIISKRFIPYWKEDFRLENEDLYLPPDYARAMSSYLFYKMNEMYDSIAKQQNKEEVNKDASIE